MNIVDFWKESVAEKTHYSQFDENEFLQALNVNVPDWREQVKNKEIWPDLHLYSKNVGEGGYLKLIINEAGVDFACFIVEHHWDGAFFNAAIALTYCAENAVLHWFNYTDFVKEKILKNDLYLFLRNCLESQDLWKSLSTVHKDLILRDLDYQEKAYLSDLLMFNIWSKELNFKKNPYVRFVTDHFKHLLYSVERERCSDREIERRIEKWDIPRIYDGHDSLHYNPSRKLIDIEHIASLVGDEEVKSRINTLKQEVREFINQ